MYGVCKCDSHRAQGRRATLTGKWIDQTMKYLAPFCAALLALPAVAGAADRPSGPYIGAGAGVNFARDIEYYAHAARHYGYARKAAPELSDEIDREVEILKEIEFFYLYFWVGDDVINSNPFGKDFFPMAVRSGVDGVVQSIVFCEVSAD